MHICFVSTFKTQCGIATYTETLAKNIKALSSNHHVTVLAESNPTESNKVDAEIPSYRIWNRFTFQAVPFVSAILNSKQTPDIIHFQHEFGLFPNESEVLNAIKALSAKIPIVTTLHTVFAPPTKTRFIHELKASSKIIVHTVGAAGQIGDDAVVIPHGVTIMPRETPDASAQYFLCPGFISKSKGHEEILDAYASYVHAQLCGNFPVTPLKIVGLCRDYAYLNQLHNILDAHGLVAHASIDARYVGDQELVSLIAGANCVILGAGKTSPYSASGQLHMALGVDIPIIAKNVPIYNNTPVALYNNSAELTQFLKNHASLHTEELYFIARHRTWTRIAAKHIAIYSAML